MNQNTANFLNFGALSGIDYAQKQFPDVDFIRNVTILAPSGNLSPVYLGGSGLTTVTGSQLLQGMGITLSVDNTKYLYAISPSGYTNVLTYIGN